MIHVVEHIRKAVVITLASNMRGKRDREEMGVLKGKDHPNRPMLFLWLTIGAYVHGS